MITGLAYGGEGVGRSGGKVCFVENALPGEKVRAKILQTKKKILKGRAVMWLETSPSRIEPICPYVKSCGGCQYQHVTYREELKWKETQVRDYLTRNLGIESMVIREINGSAAIKARRKNLELRGKTAEILEGQVENQFSSWITGSKTSKSFLFTDPPRQGMEKNSR